jgi:hypothetical protein
MLSTTSQSKPQAPASLALVGAETAVRHPFTLGGDHQGRNQVGNPGEQRGNTRQGSPRSPWW